MKYVRVVALAFCGALFISLINGVDVPNWVLFGAAVICNSEAFRNYNYER